MVEDTKCPPVYRNLGLLTFGDKKKVTEELLKQCCKNDEYLYQQIRILLDLSDPVSRKRFHPPTFENEIKSFGYKAIKHPDSGKSCYCFDNGGLYDFEVDFTTRDDDVYVKETDNIPITYYNDETIIDYDKSEYVDIFVNDASDNGYARIHEEIEENEIVEPITTTTTKTKSTTKQVTKKIGEPKKDSWCYGPYGSMKPNGWWYVGFDKDKNYNIKPAWRKNPYKEGIPSKCRAQTFTAQHTGYITKVNINVISESNKKSASPFSCEIWETKKGVPYGGAIARVEQSFVDSNAYSGAHIKTFKFNKKVVVTKGHKYAIVMRSPLSHKNSCYRIAGWPRTCYTNYMKGTYYYGYAYSSTDNGKTWVRYDKNAYGKLHSTKATTPVAFGFEVYIQPTKNVPKKVKKTTSVTKTVDKVTVTKNPVYSTGNNNFVYFNIPATNPINYFQINEILSEKPEDTSIYWDISYNGDNFNTNDLVNPETHPYGEGTYDFTSLSEKPTFIVVRAQLKTTNRKVTPTLRGVKFTVNTDSSRKAFVRSLPYCPESETMLPACIWSEVNAEYENEDNTSVKVDVVKEVEATQTVKLCKDTIEELGDYYHEFYPEVDMTNMSDDSFSNKIKDDSAFINYLKDDFSPAIYVISNYDSDDSRYCDYFSKFYSNGFELRDYPAYPMLSCNKILGERIIEAVDFKDSDYNAQSEPTQYIMDMNRDLTEELVNIVFREPQRQNAEDENETQEGVIENILEYDAQYNYTTQTFSSAAKDFTLTSDKKGIIFNLNGTNFIKNIVKDSRGKIKCFKTSDGTIEDIVESNMVCYDENNNIDDTHEDTLVGNRIELAILLQDKSYTEHVNYTVDYENKLIKPRTSMSNDLKNSCELTFTYNPLWVRDLTNDNFPLKMDLWVENFVVGDENTKYNDDDVTFKYTTKVAPRDNLREVVLYDEEDTLTRQVLVEDEDFEVDYQKCEINFNKYIQQGVPVTIRYTPNLTETSLSLCYRMDRTDISNQAYIYGNYFSTRT